ncbi:hypothetical protein N9Y92_01975 [Chlamydiales bacterium]|nr:hypothetical protein [Chlamydiales bacterium]
MHPLTRKITIISLCSMFGITSIFGTNAPPTCERSTIQTEWIERFNEAKTVEEAKESIVYLVESLKLQGYEIPDLQKVADSIPEIMRGYGLEFTHEESNVIRSIIDGTYIEPTHIPSNAKSCKPTQEQPHYSDKKLFAGLAIFCGTLLNAIPHPIAKGFGLTLITAGTWQLGEEIAYGQKPDGTAREISHEEANSHISKAVLPRKKSKN